MPMVALSHGVELTLMSVQRSLMIIDELIDNTPTAWPLVCLRCCVSIVGVLTHPCRGDGIVFDCCSSGGLMGV
jgi:hypothetical protein